jgi:hypothetical protein
MAYFQRLRGKAVNAATMCVRALLDAATNVADVTGRRYSEGL